jgi:hypothetical protein
MLRHQLPALPGLPSLVDRLPGLLAWLEDLASVPRPVLETASDGRPLPPVAAPRSTSYWGLGRPIETIRFAGANRLLVAFTYDGRPRLVEPYALRRPKTGNLLLYAFDLSAGHVKAFKVAEMQGLSASDTRFTPRYNVELMA